MFALLFGTISLMSSIAFCFQRYFEYQAVIVPTLFTSCNTLPPEGANFSRGGPSKNCRLQNCQVATHDGPGGWRSIGG